MPLVGERSKFACLKIYDDTSSSSDDDDDDMGKKLVAKAMPGTGKNKNTRSQKATSAATGGGGTKKYRNDGLIVHQIPQKPKNKGKKNKKPPVITEDGFIVQDGDEDYVEKKFQEDLQKAMAASTAKEEISLPPASNAADIRTQQQSKPVEESKDPLEMLISDIDMQASLLYTKSDETQKAREQRLVTLYRTRLLETLKQMTLENEVKLKAEAEATKYKNRYKKLCELLKDAEVNEKAHMAADLEKAKTVEMELSLQIDKLHGELMQAWSKIRELEMKNKELSAKH